MRERCWNVIYARSYNLMSARKSFWQLCLSIQIYWLKEQDRYNSGVSKVCIPDWLPPPPQSSWSPTCCRCWGACPGMTSVWTPRQRISPGPCARRSCPAQPPPCWGCHPRTWREKMIRVRSQFSSNLLVKGLLHLISMYEIGIFSRILFYIFPLVWYLQEDFKVRGWEHRD